MSNGGICRKAPATPGLLKKENWHLCCPSQRVSGTWTIVGAITCEVCNKQLEVTLPPTYVSTDYQDNVTTQLNKLMEYLRANERSILESMKKENKPSAQAAGADPSRFNSTSRQNQPIQQNCRNFGTNTAILMPFKIQNGDPQAFCLPVSLVELG